MQYQEELMYDRIECDKKNTETQYFLHTICNRSEMYLSYTS